uniref:Putative RNA ligase n=1 Tax=viral metagenome TaxID=1070528 RepID=A0A6M3JQY8_9ZZZZ
MNEYHKIQTVFKRNPENKFRTLLEGEYAIPEFEYLKDNLWVFTEKVDGTNIRIMWNHETKRLTFGGKTDRAQIQASLFKELQEMFFVQRFEQSYPETSMCLYGEGYGAKIQKGGGNYRPDQSFVLFDVKIGEWWLKRDDVESVAFQLGIEIVPVLSEGSLSEMVWRVKDGFLSQWGAFQAEGLVARPIIELTARNGQRIITKIKCKDFRCP